MTRLRPLNDYVFRKLVGEQGSEYELKSFLSAVLGLFFNSSEGNYRELWLRNLVGLVKHERMIIDKKYLVP